jgi:hypothetical protein
MRVALAAMLFTEPELLLLDEPTNYLDLEGTVWLEEYLRDYPHTVLIVSHDRELLNRSVTSILHLQQGKLTLYTGGYDTFEQTRREQQRLDLKLKKKQDDERRHIEAFIIRFKAKASKATQAQSRVKALARMQPIAELIEERVIPFVFPNPAKALASPLIRLEGAAAGYEPGRPVLYCYGDAPLPGPYADFSHTDKDLPLVVALLLRSARPGEPRLTFSAAPGVPETEAGTSAAGIFLRFLLDGGNQARAGGERMTWQWARGH